MTPQYGADVPQRQIALVDLLDRLLAGGAVIAGDVTLRIADVDLVRIDLRALISSVDEHVPSPFSPLTGNPDAARAPAPTASEEPYP